ncbi:TPA: ribosome-inactivating family protein [Morganella morganii]|uniref:ribosome-inactivating family protein n=1 Tax=Morganella morganii TaxID=582 RepID=UPI003862C995
MINRLIILFIIMFPVHSSAASIPIENEVIYFDYSNESKYMDSISALKKTLSDSTNSLGTTIVTSTKNDKIYKAKITSGGNEFIHMVFNARNAYMIGFIVTSKENNGKLKETYYRFNEDNKNNILDIKDYENITLPFKGNYIDLQKKAVDIETISATPEAIKNSVITLSKYDSRKKYDEKGIKDLKKSLLSLILITSESVRFPDVRKWSIGHFKKYDAQPTVFGIALKKLINDWGKISKELKILYNKPGKNDNSYSYMNGSMTTKPHPYNTGNAHELCDYVLYMPDKKNKQTDSDEEHHELYHIKALGNDIYFSFDQLMNIYYSINYSN